MKVSIITTCYNREHSIKNTIESVLNQDYDNIEYIIVDSASTDGTMEVVNEYKDRVTTIISEPDTGIYNTINKGIRLATGDLVGVMHSDDIFFSRNVISLVARAFEKNEIDLLYGNGIFINLKTKRVVRNWISGTFHPSKIVRGWLPLHTTVYIKREIVNKYGLYDESFKIAADSEFLLRYMYELNLNIYYLNRYLIRMGMGGASTSLSKTFPKWKEDKRLYEAHGLNPYVALPRKILSKVKQFF
ncbi:MAG: glycosyltransferase [Candidatus Azobacteroides sp.]|nr:glycosyltransferase [Candidatus Azobacteroides sp.]